MDNNWIWVVLAAGALATYLWRAVGVAISGRMHVGSPVFLWFGCVAYALMAGLIARMIILPIGPLQETALWERLLSAAVALGVFLLFRRNLALGVGAGIGTLMAVRWLL